MAYGNVIEGLGMLISGGGRNASQLASAGGLSSATKLEYGRLHDYSWLADSVRLSMKGGRNDHV